MKRNAWIGFGGGVLAVAGVVTYFAAKPKDEVKWRSIKLERGNVTQRISATGTVNAMVQVAVGTQVSGVISALYVDYNSLVKKGQLIAQIDPTVMQTQLDDAKASLLRAQAAYDFAKADYERSKRLAEAKLLADQDLDTKVTALKTAKGNLGSAQATLDRARANLGYCNITAPVDGVVISRLADVGQTVAASFSTPNLFQIAQDLSKMKVQISIDESDIDQVKVGQRGYFTVDSLPEKQFMATVSQVRLEPITNSNVVTYNVVMEVPNEPLPGTDAASGPAAGRPIETDPEKAWERAKDRLPEGTTKEAFLQRFKARMVERAQAGSDPKTAPLSAAGRLAAARTPGGASLVGGPVFSGNLALRPGMTANVTIMTNQRRDVLRVPNAALRFNPAAFVKEDKKSATGAARPGGPGQGQQRPGGAVNSGMVAKREDRIWTLVNGQPKVISVKAGISDGQFTEVSGEGLTVGMPILVGVEEAKKNGSGPMPLGGPRGMH